MKPSDNEKCSNLQQKYTSILITCCKLETTVNDMIFLRRIVLIFNNKSMLTKHLWLISCSQKLNYSQAYMKGYFFIKRTTVWGGGEGGCSLHL